MEQKIGHLYLDERDGHGRLYSSFWGEVQRRVVPFSATNTARLDVPNNRHRKRQYRQFTGDLLGKSILDIGERNFITDDRADNTIGDLTWGIKAPNDAYDVVTCFEVIQHVMNPALLLAEIHGLLRPNGILYLATPKPGPLSWYHGQENFVEYKPRQLRLMLEYCGFRVLKYEVRNPWPFRFIFYGFRPPLRYIFNRYQLYECEKI